MQAEPRSATSAQVHCLIDTVNFADRQFSPPLAQIPSAHLFKGRCIVCWQSRPFWWVTRQASCQSGTIWDRDANVDVDGTEESMWGVGVLAFQIYPDADTVTGTGTDTQILHGCWGVGNGEGTDRQTF